jgi:polyisoprenoid-binding protein YceI
LRNLEDTGYIMITKTCRRHTPARPSSTGGANVMTQPESATATPAPGTYQLDPDRTTVTADVKAMFGLMTVHGTFKLRSGEVTVAADAALSTVRATIAAGSYASGNATRDTDVVSANLLDAQAHPDITFEGTGTRQDGDGWVVSGSMTAHGTSVPTEIRVTEARMADGAARFRATVQLDRTSFGITKKKATVGRTADVVIDAVGAPA